MHKFTIYSVTDVGENLVGITLLVPTLNAKKALRIYAKKNNIKLLVLKGRYGGEYSASACGYLTQRRIKTPIFLSAYYFTSIPDIHTSSIT